MNQSNRKLFDFSCIRRKKSNPKNKIIPLNYTLPGTSLTVEEMSHVRDRNHHKMIDQKKLHLILDLDNTLIHTTTLDTLSSADREFIRKKLNKQVKDSSYILKKRPGVSTFLKELSSMFDMTVYTLAGRSYAKMVTDILDPDESVFKHAITYEDCTLRGQKGLDVVMYHERVVLVVDDLQEVWSRHIGNLIQIEPYTFFESQNYDVEKLVNEELGCDMDVELARVLETLKIVHGAFYYGESDFKDLEKKDVRDVLNSVLSMDHKTVLYENNNGDISALSNIPCKRGRKFYVKRAFQLALYASF